MAADTDTSAGTGTGVSNPLGLALALALAPIGVVTFSEERLRHTTGLAGTGTGVEMTAINYAALSMEENINDDGDDDDVDDYVSEHKLGEEQDDYEI